MAYQRGTFGIEFRQGEPSEETSWLAWAVGVAVLIALIYGSIAVYRRVIHWLDRPPAPSAQVPAGGVADEHVAAPEPDVSAAKVVVADERPRNVRNLLMKLDEAIAATNYPVQIATIEALRALPGSPAADIDDTLARSLGRLNLRMLFSRDHRNEWVSRVEIKRGYSASRIASEYGTTLKCVERLNGNVSSIQTGKFLWVMNHPQFRLSVFRKTGIADLSLNGKFFKRYYLTSTVTGVDGSYTFPAKTRSLLSEHGVRLGEKDLAELEMLLPKGAKMTIAEFR